MANPDAETSPAPDPQRGGACPECRSDSGRAAPACPPSLAAIERLVREGLGCNCPAEVFEHIEESPVTLPGLTEPGRRFAIGGRLLVYLIAVADANQALTQLPFWLTLGRVERDAAAMNRLRLVLITAAPEAISETLQRAFAALPGHDERTHLHVLPRAAIAGI